MTEIIIVQRMWQRRGTAAEWAAQNPVLAAGEIGVELGATAADPQRVKVGNGVSAWSALPWAGGGSGGGSVWYNGSGVPVPAIGNDGDQYLDTTTSDVYAKEAGAWVFKVNIKGAQGIQGPQGIPGPRGGGIVTSTQALLHFDGTSGATAITDSVDGSLWDNIGGAQLSSVRSRFGPTSLRLSNASGRQYVQLPDKPALNYQLDFTAEGWFWRESATRNTFFSKTASGAPAGTWYVAAMPDGALRTVFGTGSFQIFDSSPGQVPVGAWVHIAVSKQGLAVRSFVNGALVTTGTLAAQPADMGNPLRVGAEATDATADRDFLGWADDFRYSAGALYTAAFAPPTTAFGLPVSPQLPAYTRANLPPAAGNEYCLTYVTDLTGGGEPCVSDGVSWRRFSDRSVAS